MGLSASSYPCLLEQRAAATQGEESQKGGRGGEGGGVGTLVTRGVEEVSTTGKVTVTKAKPTPTLLTVPATGVLLPSVLTEMERRKSLETAVNEKSSVVGG